MTNSILGAIAETPWWTYLIFIYFIRISLYTTRPRIVPIQNLIIFPLVLLSFMLIGFYSIKEWIHLRIILMSLFALIVGVGLGWLQFFLLKIKAVRNEAKLYLPGTWTLFCVVLIMFVFRCYYSYYLFLDPQLFFTQGFAIYYTLFFALAVGLFIGRLACALRRIQIGPYA